MRSIRLTVLLLAVVLFQAVAQITLNPLPTRVIGQTSTTIKGLTPNLVEGREFDAPVSVVVDGSTSPSPIYVADVANNRILGFRSSTGFANAPMADIVIGQPDFVSTNPQGPSARSTRTTGLSTPEGLAVDASGNLYVIDAANNRILRFPRPFTQTGDQLPDLVIGQADFSTSTSNLGGLSAKSLSFTVTSTSGSVSALQAGLAFDAAGNLWVADAGNNRIVRFNAALLGAQAKPNPAADLVLGQPDFISGGSLTTPPLLTSFTAIETPSAVAFDSAGRLFALEAVNGQRGRVLVWFPSFAIGKAASRMLGVDLNSPQPPNVSEFQFSQSPSGLVAVGNQMGVIDSFNHRILLFLPVDQWNSNNFFQAAVAVVGQADFSGASANRGQPSPGPSTLARPVGAFFFNSEMYVADTGNNRVVVLPQTGSAFGPATRVLGQLAMDLNSPNLIQGGKEFNFSTAFDAGIAVDFSSSVPHLYVADSYNNRILGYNDLRNIQAGAAADIVIGQPDFLHAVSNYPNGPSGPSTSSSLSLPIGLAVDAAGNLWVADTGNGRVLRFPKPFANYQPGALETADLLLGQTSYSFKITDATSRTMASPYGLAFTSDHGLLVSDLGNNRVLFFSGPPAQFTNGMAATTVFGQTDMTSSAGGSGLNKMSIPHHIATDSDDRLYVADTGNGRVLIFDRASLASNGVFAAMTLQNGLSSPRGVNVNQATGDIWVADVGTNSAIRYPNFNNLIAGNLASNTTLSDYGPLALAEDNWGNLFVADAANRVVIYYPGLAALNAANFISGYPLTPGLITALYSTGATGQFGKTSASATTVPLPKQLNGVQVLLNNTPAALFYAGTDQINFEVPSNAPTSGTADLQVIEIATGRVLGDTTVVMYSTSPGVFTQDSNGIGAGVIANADGTLNTQTNPAAQGTIITIYMTGQGYIPGMPADGDVLGKPLSTPIKPNVLIGGTGFVPPETILYSGLAPTLVGVWQINVIVPSYAITLPGNPTQVLIEQNSIPSGGGGFGRPVFVYVKRP